MHTPFKVFLYVHWKHPDKGLLALYMFKEEFAKKKSAPLWKQ